MPEIIRFSRTAHAGEGKSRETGSGKGESHAKAGRRPWVRHGSGEPGVVPF